MLTESEVKIVCKVLDDKFSPETYRSYTVESTSFNFSLSWNGSFNNRDFYSNNTIIWDFGDGTVYTGASAKHFYKTPNLYNVNATIFDKEGNAHTITLKETLTAENIFPDYIYLHPLNPLGYAYNLPAGKRSEQIIVTRYNSWQNEQFLKDNDYTINLYVSGSKSDHITLSAYYSEKYSHLKAYHGFVNVSVNSNNYIQTKIVESTKTNSVSVYAVPYTTGLFDNNWDIKFNFYNYPKEGSSFVGSSGTNYEYDYVYFIDQKASTEVDIIYASFDSKSLKDNEISKNNLEQYFQNYDQGYLNLPYSAQIIRSIFNSASTIRITSNGISTEGNNTTVGKLSAQILYPFDIYPIKWSNSNIPFVLNFKDNENYSVKTYDPIYNFHTGSFNSKINDVNLKLVKFVNIDPFSEYTLLSAVELKEAIFSKNNKVPQYNDSPYFAGTVSLPYEAKVAAISATIKIQDTPIRKIFPIYGFLSQIGVPKIKRIEKVNVFDYCKTENLDFYYNRNLSTFTNTSTANVHICFSPLKILDESKENRVFILDADNEKIYKTDVTGNIVSIMDLSSMRYLIKKNEAPITISFLNENNAASPVWCSTDKNGNAYVSLADNISAIKINYDTDVVSQIYAPPFKNLELYDSQFYGLMSTPFTTKNGYNLKSINGNNIVSISKTENNYQGFAGENTIIPSCIDIDANDNVYVAYTHPLSNFICKYKNNGELINTIYFNSLEVPQEIIIDADSNIWVGIENINESTSVNLDRNDLIYFIDGKTLEKTIIRDIEGFGMMTIDNYQNLYVLNRINTITKIDASTKTKKDYIFGESAEENPYLKDIGAIAVDSSGELWVANNVDGKLYFGDTDNMSKPLSSLPFEKLKDLNLKTTNELASIYFVMGDWTGFRWINKFVKTEIPEPRIINGLSTYFDILNPTPTIAKKGEDFNSINQIKSYILQESLFDKNVILDDFLGQILGKNENVEEIGKVIYEKITNFVSNNSDIDTCNIKQLLSFAEQTGTNLSEYLYSYPPSVRRALDLLSICQRKLFGNSNSYNRTFNKYSASNNLGDNIKIENGHFIAGKPIISYELFSEKYTLITNTIVPNYNLGEMVPLSSVNYDWGWGLVTGTRAQSGLELNQYYKFYEYIPNNNLEIYDSIIDFDSSLTTITPQQSSFEDWSKFGGNMDKVLSYGLYKGLKLIK
jgi:hypothetical protein